ncbi:MAG TPA: hypothetical protein VN706_01295 [Gemmatimonadaceae bacterium]|nr:hypothetical protein [Gemmatimonadaceae bacterium]
MYNTSDIRRTVAALAGLALCLVFPTVARSQTISRATINGEWTGTLVLDNSQPSVSMVFQLTDSTLAGKVYNDGALMGPMEQMSITGNVIHFKVGRFDFTGTVAGTRMAVSLIVYNGTTRKFTAIKSPGAPRDTGLKQS